MSALRSTAISGAAAQTNHRHRFFGLDSGDWSLILLSLWVLGALLAFV
jgi:hypothetical protein